MRIVECACGAKLEVTIWLPGDELKCARCHAVVTVPEQPDQTPGHLDTRGLGVAGVGRGSRAPRTTGVSFFIGTGTVSLFIIVVLVLVLKGRGADGKKDPTDEPSITPEKIFERCRPTDAHGWLDFADTLRKYGFPKKADEALLKACQMKPDDPEISRRYASLLESEANALNPKADDYCDRLFAIAEEAEKAGLKSLCELICIQIAGDRVKTKGINPKHPGANKKLGRKLTPYGDWDEADLVDSLSEVLLNQAAERKLLNSLTPWQRNAYGKKKDIEKSGMKCTCVSEMPYLIAVQESPAYSAEVIAEDFRKCAEHLYKLFRKEYAEKFQITDIFEGPQAGEVLPIIVYDSKKTYMEKNSVPEWAGGHFDPNTGWIHVYKGTEKPYETVFHEGTHQLVGAATKLKGGKDTNMFWFTEGIATYFEDFKRDANMDFVLGIKSVQYLPLIQQAMKKKQQVPFKDIIGKSYLQFRMEQAGIQDPFRQNLFVGLHYAESWSIVYFFYTYENGKYRDKFNQYFEKEISGEGTVQNFTSIFGDMGALEKEWTDFISTLPPN